MMEQIQEIQSWIIENFPISRLTIAVLVLLVGAAFLGNLISNRLIQRAVEKRGGGEHASKAAKRLSSYIIFSLLTVAILGVLGVPPTALGTLVGLIGLGVSFALRDIIQNFISGILLMITRPISIGDQIEVGGEEGTVKDIQIRASVLKTYDGRKLIVPNSDLYNKTVINNTAYDERRFELKVGVGYEDNIKKAKEASEEALEEAETVSGKPEPQVLVDELGDSSVNLKLRGWTNPSRASLVAASSEVTEIVKEKFDEEGIDIPYPIRTVYMEE